MSDRLQELLRQRAAIQTHLDWLDREIAQAHAAEVSAANTAPAVSAIARTSPLPIAALPRLDTHKPDPDTLLASYRQDTQNLHTDLRKGCLLYFFGALLLLGLGIVAFYFVNRLIREYSEHAPTEQHAVTSGER